MTKLFHKEVFWPHGKLDEFHNLKFPLEFSRHSLKSCLDDKYGTILPPKEILFDKNNVFELELTDGMVTKISFRIKYDFTDLIMVVIPARYSFFVKTLWRNKKEDLHSTLNHSLYSKEL